MDLWIGQKTPQQARCCPNNPAIQLSNLPFQMAGPLDLLRVQGFEMAGQRVKNDEI